MGNDSRKGAIITPEMAAQLGSPWDESKPTVPPDGNVIVRPFKELTTFFPNDQPYREELGWVDQIENRFLRPLGMQMARIFRVDLIDDMEYISMSEEAKNAQLSCCMTRAGIIETQTGFSEWYPLLVVVKYCIFVAIHLRAERSTARVAIPKLLLWSQAQQAYVPVTDPESGYIQNPAVLLPILDRYAKIEGLD